MFLPERSYSQITVYTQPITNAGMAHTNVTLLTWGGGACKTRTPRRLSFGRVLSGTMPQGAMDEESRAVVFDMIKQQVNLNLNINDISTAHRLGAPRSGRPDKRSIMLKVSNNDLKSDILGACRRVRPSFYVNESLTTVWSSVLYVLRKANAKYSLKIMFCRSVDGNICAFLPPATETGSQLRKLVINSKSKLEQFLSAELKTTLSEFGEIKSL